MRICAISDTHKKHHYLKLPSQDEVDMIIHAGDFSASRDSFYNFINWYANLDFKYKILVAGNHDWYVSEAGYGTIFNICKKRGIIYLEDSSIEIEGTTFHGSPWSNRFWSWSFMASEEKLAEYWSLIPDKTEVLITHGPAYKSGDRVNNNASVDRFVGSTTLKKRIASLDNLKLHIYGHIHESYGTHFEEGQRHISCNASSLDYYKSSLNRPMIFEIKANHSN